MDLDQLCLIGGRGLHIAACALLLGDCLVLGWIAGRAGAGADLVRRLGRCAAAGVVLTGLLWLLLQARDLADGDAVWPTLRVVAWHTRFGQALLARCALAALAALVLELPAWASRDRARLATAPMALGVATLAATGHGAAAGDAVLTLALVAHVLAASAWLGALLPLALVLRWAEPGAALAAARRFSWLGAPCVALLLAGALVQAPLIGAPAALVGTPYGRVIVLKAGLLAALLVLALGNFRLVARAAAATERAWFGLRRRVWLELALGATVLMAASWLLELAPGAHQQVAWPFPWRPSLVAWSEPTLRHELVGAGFWLLGAGALAAIGVFARALRAAMLALAAAAALWAMPGVALLLVPATPTSFYRSPTGFSAASVMAGARLYPGACAACHGTDARGDGPRAAALPVPPADLMAPHLWGHTDGELFGWLSDGITDWRGDPVMPGFAGQLDPDQRWALIDYIRARNAGLDVPATGADPAGVERGIVRLGLRQRTTSGAFHVHS